VSPFWRTLLVRLVIVGAIIVIVPLIALILLVTLPITVVPTMPSTALLWWSDAVDRVPTGTMPVVILVTPVFLL
jgi:hypothetical protein